MQRQVSSRPVAIWLLIGVGMLIVQIALGGITRLTGSGLSITEWNLVTGALPPMNHAKWMEEFEKYRQTPQYQLLNFDFTLADFKSIFFWEWFHRLWARLMSVVFLIPFIYFLVKGYFRKWMLKPLLILFVLGAMQGAIGWIMVASGLVGDATYVAPTRLALHFVFALGLLSYTFWFALKLLLPAKDLITVKNERKLIFVILALLVVQLGYGALMAGHKAATAAPTWPDINGYLVPPQLMKDGVSSFIANKIMVHFMHRGLAYLLFILVVILTVRLYKIDGSAVFRKARVFPLLLTLLQIILGIAAVLSSTAIVPNHWGRFEWMAQIHQLTAMCILLSLLLTLYLVRNKNPVG